MKQSTCLKASDITPLLKNETKHMFMRKTSFLSANLEVSW